MARWIKLILFLSLFSCTPKKGSITAPPTGSTGDGGQAPAPVINSVVVSNYEFIINGSNLQDITSVTLSSNTRSTANKSFKVISATINQLITVAIDSVKIPTNTALNLILGNAYGQTGFPIDFTVQNGEVVTSSIQDFAISTVKIQNKAVTLSKLSPNEGDTPVNGNVVTWSASCNCFILGPGGGGGARGAAADERLKNDISNLATDDAEEIINNLKVKSFKLKTDNPMNKNYSVGFVAQDVLEIFPDAVNKRADGYYTLAYDSIFSTAVLVIQSQQKKIRELEEGQKRLEAKLEALLSRGDK